MRGKTGTPVPTISTTKTSGAEMKTSGAAMNGANQNTNISAHGEMMTMTALEADVGAVGTNSDSLSANAAWGWAAYP